MKSIFIKFKKLDLRLKLLVITGFLIIVGMFLYWIFSPLFLTVPCTFFIISIFYNLFVELNQANITKEDINKEIKEGKKEYKEGNRFVGAVKTISVPFAFGIGIPGIIISLIALWLITFNI